MYLIFDTETTGLPKNYNAPLTDFDNWPRMVQLAWQLHDENGELISVENYIVKPDGYEIPFNASKIHGITTERAEKQGLDLKEVLDKFSGDLEKCQFVAGHNISFDLAIVGCEYLRCELENKLEGIKDLDTKDAGTEYCAIPGGKGGGYKWPRLDELHKKLFDEGFDEAHNAAADVEATTRSFLEMIRLGLIGPKETGLDPSYFEEFKEKNPKPFKAIGLNVQPYDPGELEESQESEEKGQRSEETSPNNQITESPDNTQESGIRNQESEISEALSSEYVSLHNHTQFSILQATCEVNNLIDKAKEFGMKALAITDKGNMFGAFKFQQAASKAEIKPIIGCEFYVCDDHTNKSVKDDGNMLVLLAKNQNGYRNLCKMSAISFLDGFYYVPRIDKDVLLEYKEDLIALSGGLRGEPSRLLLNHGEKRAEESILWYKEHFGQDYYLELLRHGVEEEDVSNEFFIRMSQKHDVKVIAQNNVFYVTPDDAKAHDILLCVKDNAKQSTPIGKGRDKRYGFPNNEFSFKSPAEMSELFKDIPESISNITEIVDKVEEYQLKRDVLLPAFEIPDEFETEDDYLKHLTYEGAKQRYEEITPEIKERLDFELETIKNTGYPGYFLIVQDFTSEARKMGVSVGPGRGSAAGSAVAYCIGITNVDPIKYDLLFERFLNPDRISLPDIDIDFDDEGRGKVIDFVVEKYGKNQVAQIITYGSMAAKSALRDTARVLELPLSEADQLAKMMPDTKLKKMFGMEDKALKEKLGAEQFERAQQMKEIAKGNDLQANTINQATVLEGSLRNTGTHACGVIITPTDMTELIPVASAKDADLMVTQYDNSVIESAGMLKMDFLGLKTLSIINHAIRLIKEKHGVEIDVDEIPLDDTKTYELYQRGETNGTFQFESPGMQKHLKALKPDKFADLIAMNALYRPGPMEYIPNFIARKQGREEITYDIDDMEEYLAETYGITVYQEQVMLLSQKLAGFTKGEADVLRKAMGKKIFALLDQLKPKFLEGCEKNGHDKVVAEKVWKDWEAFAAYAFNKSHSTCYSVIAFHTAYLKANYPAEYMASVLTNNMNDISKVAFFMEECKRLNIPVLSPDVNESHIHFTVNNEGAIRFGLGAVKGVGEAAVEIMIQERNQGGAFTSLFDLVQRVDLRSVNKRTLESLAMAGAFDGFDNAHRAQYFATDELGRTGIELAVKFANAVKQSENSSQINMFGEESSYEVTEPELPKTEEWGTMEFLSKEKEVVGVYISGHPLDDYRLEIENFTNANLTFLNQVDYFKGREMKFAATVTGSRHGMTKRGKPFGVLTLEDYSESQEIFLFGEDYVNFKNYMVVGWHLYVHGKVMEHKFKENEWEFKIAKIELLSDLRDKMARSITLNVPETTVNEDFVQKIGEISDKHKGKVQLVLKLLDKKEKQVVELRSRSKKVNITDEFLEELSGLKEVNYTIN